MKNKNHFFSGARNKAPLFMAIWILGWIIYNFFTIKFSPLPWLDEVYYADMANSVQENGKLYLRMSYLPSETGKEMLIYGPVYFYLQAFIIKLFGLKIEVIRALNMIAGIGIVFLFLWVLKKNKLGPIGLVLFGLLITTDTIFVSNMHSGRMDLLCIALFYVAMFLFMYKRSIYFIPLCGLIFATAFLTTPRVGFYFLGLIFLFFNELYRREKSIINVLADYALLGLIFLIPVFSWIFYKFNSIGAYVSYLTTNPLMKTHLGINLIPNNYQLPVISIWVLFLIILLLKRKFRYYDILFSIIISCHLFFIVEAGPYSAMIMPLIYTSILLSAYRLKDEIHFKKIIPALIIVLLFINCSIFFFKSVLVVSEKEKRSPDITLKMLKQYDLKDKIILADLKYYYIVKALNSNFVSFENNEEILSEKFLSKMDYIIISQKNFNNLKGKFPLASFNIIPLKQAKTETQTTIYKKLAKFGFSIAADYEGYLIKLR